MRGFAHEEDFDFALRLAKERNPALDLSGGDMRSSLWDQYSIEINDSSGSRICSVPSGELIRYIASFEEPASAPEAVRIARQFIVARNFVSGVLTVALLVVGLIIAFGSASTGEPLAFVVPIIVIGIAFLNHWLTRASSISIELLANMSEDLRALRSRVFL